MCRADARAAAGRRIAAPPEFPVYSVQAVDSDENAAAGIVDALTISPTGAPEVVIDWKSDVNPSARILDGYRAQLRAYLDITGAREGLIVLMTSGFVVEVPKQFEAS